MRLKPYPHQVLGTNYLLDNNGGAIYSDPRTGKTLMVLRALEKSGNFPALIICPAPVISSWLGSLLEDGVDRSLIVNLGDIDIIRSKSLIINSTAKYFICNFERVVKLDIIEILDKISDIFGIGDWKAIIIDESYRIASFDSSISQYVVDCNYKPEQMRICLTGTPICESPLDAVNPYIFMNGNFFGYIDPFVYRNSNYKEYGYKWKPKNRIHKSKVEAFVKNNSFQVKLKDLALGGEVLKGLEVLEPSQEMIRLNKWVALTNQYFVDGEEREMYSAIRCIFWQKISSGIHPITNEIFDLSKAEHIADHQSMSGDQILVLSRFRTGIDEISALFNDRGIPSDVIHGKIPKSKREEVRLKFQEGKIKIVVAQVNTVARGLDFSKLDRIYYYTNAYSFETRKQSELRGQNVKRVEPYSVVDLCFDNSIDLKIRKILLTKESDVSNYLKDIDIDMLNQLT